MAAALLVTRAFCLEDMEKRVRIGRFALYSFALVIGVLVGFINLCIFTDWMGRCLLFFVS